MKRILVIILTISSVLVNAGVKIKGELKNSSEVKYVYLYEYTISFFELKDSAMVKNEKFQFKFKDIQKARYRLGVNRMNAVDVIMGSENLSITADAKDFKSSFKIEESAENDKYNLFIQKHGDFVKSSEEINMRARKVSNVDPKRNEKIGNLQKEFDVAKTEMTKISNEIIKDYPQSFAAINASFFLGLDSVAKEDFFNKYDDQSLASGEMFSYAYNNFLSRFLNGKTQTQLKNELINAPKSKPEKSFGREVIYLSMIDWLKAMDPKFAAKIATGFYKEYPDSPFRQEIRESLPTAPPGIGDYAPDIVLNNPEGQEMKLSSTKGKIVLLDFWASWCGPCRRENPNVVKTYEKYKDKGFTVFSVSLDKQANRWKSAIEKDKLVWDTHVSDLKGWSSKAGKAYGVSSIPSTFLIDKDGIIIAKNLRGHQLENKLKEILGE